MSNLLLLFLHYFHSFCNSAKNGFELMVPKKQDPHFLSLLQPKIMKKDTVSTYLSIYLYVTVK